MPLIAGLLLAACSSSAPLLPPKSPAKTASPTEPTTVTGPYHWEPTTRLPQWVEPDAKLRDLAKRCQRFELGLMHVAEQVAQRQAQHGAALAPDELKFALRSAGVPQVWEKVWSLSGQKLNPEDATQRIDAWLGKRQPIGELRCGIAAATSQDLEALVVIAIDALGDLAPIPTHAHLGEWISVDAQLHVPTRNAKVVVMGPTGAPRALLTSAPRNDRVIARVAVDQPGPWLIQVLSEHDAGPRPTLEAMVFVDSEPPSHFEQHAALGETAGQGIADQHTALLRMINAARSNSGLNAVVPDPDLGRLAAEHVQAMLAAQQVAHDLGSGGPADRIAAGGLNAVVVGENLATASSLVNAHRALWSSPSHRSAMLEPRFTAVGIGVATGEDRSIWVCELFANFGATGKIAPAR